MSGSISRTYTFTDGTTAYGSQVDAEIQNIVTDVNNLDAGTSTWTNVNATTSVLTTATITTGTVTSLNSLIVRYRKPRIVYGTGTTVTVETGLDGTSGDMPLIFPDGTVRTETSATLTTFDTTRNAVLTGTKQGGIRSGSVVVNTKYCLYGVKATDTTTNWVLVGDTVTPTQANFATLNTNFGTNGWVYLGTVWYGDDSGATGAIVKFVQSGNRFYFRNSCAAVSSGTAGVGVSLANATSAGNVTYTYATGTGSRQIPSYITTGFIVANVNPGSSGIGQLLTGTANTNLQSTNFAVTNNISAWMPLLDNVIVSGPASSNFNLYLAGFEDPLLSASSGLL